LFRLIDPASGTINDAFNKRPDGSPRPHKVGRNATAFTSDEALLKAEGIKYPVSKGWKSDMKITQYPGLDGLTADQMNYHERKIFDQFVKDGFDMKNSQIPLTDKKINKLIKEYC